MNNLVIAGAFYYDREANTILVPHYTGEYTMVDCDEHIPMEELKERYDEDYIKDAEESFITLNGNEYYYAEYSPWAVNDWELLSDLSELRHNETHLHW